MSPDERIVARLLVEHAEAAHAVRDAERRRLNVLAAVEGYSGLMVAVGLWKWKGA